MHNWKAVLFIIRITSLSQEVSQRQIREIQMTVIKTELHMRAC